MEWNPGLFILSSNTSKFPFGVLCINFSIGSKWIEESLYCISSLNDEKESNDALSWYGVSPNFPIEDINLPFDISLSIFLIFSSPNNNWT